MKVRAKVAATFGLGWLTLSLSLAARGQDVGVPKDADPQKASASAPAPTIAPGSPSAAAAPGIVDGPPPARSLNLPTPSSEELRYKQRWAVVVGINYSEKDRAKLTDRGRIPALDKAENDAEDVARILVDNYGYDKDKVILLKGKAATKEAIEELLNADLLCNGGKVGPEDSVLFYFSGHGEGPESPSSEGGHAYLLPFDVKTETGMDRIQIHPNTAIDLNATLETIQREKKSQARHLLLVLDCCYSGAVFQMEGASGGRSEHQGVDASVFRTRAIQAITASRATQKASDGAASERNSPFTSALLRAMKEIPPGLPKKERFYYTTNQLFAAMRAYQGSSLSADQSPLCRWLDKMNAGEFHFFPDPDARFDDVSEESRRLLLTMVPSTFGNWWAEEMPWFMPGLRLEILQNRPGSKSTLAEEIDKVKLRDAARLTLARLRSDHDLTPSQRQRCEHLQIMLDLDRSLDRKAKVDQLIGQLRKAVGSPPALGEPSAGNTAAPEAVDVHYLAVLQHAFGDTEEAKKHYDWAINLYRDEAQRLVRMQALEALCRSDLGLLELQVRHDYDAACSQFQQARELFGIGSPIPFRVFCLTNEATSWRRKGFVGVSDARMKDALELARQFDPEQKHPLTAAAWKQYAWADMEGWRFAEAATKFTEARKILTGESNRDREECQIDRFHVEHGLAMIERFQGADREAIAAYGRLTRDLHTAIQTLERQSGGVSNLAEIRSLMYDRLVNSLERQADCYLFGRRPDYESAAYYYRRALQLVDQVPASRQDQTRSDLTFRQVIALCLHGQSLLAKDPESPARAETDEARFARTFLYEQARRQYDRAMKNYGQLWPQYYGSAAVPDDSIAVRRPPIRAELSRMIALTCLNLVKKGETQNATPPKPKETGGDASPSTTPDSPERSHQLYDLVVELCDSNRQFDRDELERLMFASRLLIRQKDSSLDKFMTLDLNDRLHEFCRSSLRVSGDDPGVLAYLRPYYDAVFETKTELQPFGVKELIEVVWEATTGDLNPPQDSGEPALVMYFLRDRCHLILDVPDGKSGRFEIDPSEVGAVGDLKLAKESERVLACPDGLRKALRALKLAEGGKFWVLHRDPVQGIGVQGIQRRVMRPVEGQPTSSIADYAGQEAGDAAEDFPFDIRSALANPKYEIGQLRPAGVPRLVRPPSQVGEPRQGDGPVAKRGP